LESITNASRSVQSALSESTNCLARCGEGREHPWCSTRGSIAAACSVNFSDRRRLFGAIFATLLLVFILINPEPLLIPFVFGQAMDLNSVSILLFTLAMSSLFGLTGAILAVPAAAMFKIAIEEFYFQRLQLNENQSRPRQSRSFMVEVIPKNGDSGVPHTAEFYTCVFSASFLPESSSSSFSSPVFDRCSSLVHLLVPSFVPCRHLEATQLSSEEDEDDCVAYHRKELLGANKPHLGFRPLTVQGSQIRCQ
jgi:hypothetical protein